MRGRGAVGGSKPGTILAGVSVALLTSYCKSWQKEEVEGKRRKKKQQESSRKRKRSKKEGLR